jgi:hypothetical protein
MYLYIQSGEYVCRYTCIHAFIQKKLQWFIKQFKHFFSYRLAYLSHIKDYMYTCGYKLLLSVLMLTAYCESLLHIFFIFI